MLMILNKDNVLDINVDRIRYFFWLIFDLKYYVFVRLGEL